MSMPTLVEHGIQEESSDVRAHVSVVNKKVYAYRTVDALAIIEKNNFPIGYASQPGTRYYTGEGFLVPWDEIANIYVIDCKEWKYWAQFRALNISTTDKSHIATKVVWHCINTGKFRYTFCAREAGYLEQIKGIDIVGANGCKIQVKCDWLCGERPKGTGNLFLQRAERNPFKRY